MKALRKIFMDKGELVRAYQTTFSSPSGEIVLAHLAKTCHVFEPVAVSGDPNMTYLQDGERRVVLSILRQLGYDLNKLQQLQESITNE